MHNSISHFSCNIISKASILFYSSVSQEQFTVSPYSWMAVLSCDVNLVAFSKLNIVHVEFSVRSGIVLFWRQDLMKEKQD